MKRKNWLISGMLATCLALFLIASAVLADTTYVVQTDDTMGSIATRFGTTVQALADANNIVNPNFIYIGQVLTVPDGASAQTPTDGSNAPILSISLRTYTVQFGDTMSAIAARFDTTVAEIAALNGIANPNWIYVGQVLTIPNSGWQPTTEAAQPTTAAVGDPNSGRPSADQNYVVRHGDTINSISRNFSVPVDEIVSRNGIINPNFIYVGQVLVIPGSGVIEPTATPVGVWPTATPSPDANATVVAPAEPTATQQSGVWPTATPAAGAWQPTPTPESGAWQPTATPAASAGSGNFLFGGQTHTLANPDLMHNIGMEWVKFQHKWSVGDGPGNIAGRISDAHAKGFKVLMAIPGSDHSHIDFGAYVEFLRGVAALPDPPDAIEVWNEMNIDREWPNGQISGTQYTNEMLKPAYAAIKASNPNVMVISGAPAPTGYFGGGCSPAGCDDGPYLREMAAAGAADAMDCIGIHYNEGILPPSATSGDPRGNSGHYTRYFSSMNKTYLEAFSYKKPLCYTEIGYLSGDDYGGVPGGFNWAAETSILEHAQWLGEAVAMSKADPNIEMMIIFNVDFTHYESDGDPQAGFAIVRKDGSCPACANIAIAMGKQ